MQDFNRILTPKQKRRKKRLKWRTLNPVCWFRLKRPTVSKEFEDRLLTLIILYQDNIDVFIEENQRYLKKNFGDIYPTVHMEYNIVVGPFIIWNSNRFYGDADIHYYGGGKQTILYASRKICFAFYDLILEAKKFEKKICKEKKHYSYQRSL